LNIGPNRPPSANNRGLGVGGQGVSGMGVGGIGARGSAIQPGSNTVAQGLNVHGTTANARITNRTAGNAVGMTGSAGTTSPILDLGGVYGSN
jgi:hypothetical protein